MQTNRKRREDSKGKIENHVTMVEEDDTRAGDRPRAIRRMCLWIN